MVEFITAVIIISSNLFLGFLAFSKNPKSWTNRLFLLLTLILALWIGANTFSVTVEGAESIFFWIKTVMVITSALFSTIFLLSNAYPHNQLLLDKKWVVLTVLVTVVTQYLVLINQVFVRVEITDGVPAPVPGPGIVVFAANILTFFVLSVVTLIKKYRQASGRERAQLKYLLFGILTTFILTNITNFIFVNVLHMTRFVAVGPVFTLILVGSISYAIVKHRFLDIRLVVARAVVFALLIAFFGLFYSLFFVTLSTLFLRAPISLYGVFVSALFALIMVFSFQKVLFFLENITEKIFYKNRYDANKLLYDLAVIMSSTINLKDLTHQILNQLFSQIKVTRGVFILIRDGHIFEVAQDGFKGNFEIDETQILSLVRSNKTLVLEELDEGPLKSILRNYDFTVSIPLYSEGSEIGVLALGEKLSGDLYSPEDIRVLEILAPEAAVAIQNTISYEQIKRFNVTLQQEVEQATHDLRAANLKLEELDRLKDDFVTIASHELRTPMTAIRSYAWMALYKPDIALSEKIKRYLDRVLVSTERLINLVNDMLNISRIESGKVEIIPLQFNVQKFTSDILQEVGPKAREKNITFDMTPAQIPDVFADSDKVHQVLLNLLGNAIKFTPQGGRIVISFFSDGDIVEVSVKDSGVGISKEDLPRLFQKFGRLDDSYVAAATSGGTGLGLYISKNLVTLMGGKIWAQSEGSGKGSSFIFSLPVASAKNITRAPQLTRKVAGDSAKQLEPVAL